MGKLEPNCHLFTRVEPLVLFLGVHPSNLYQLCTTMLDSSSRVRGLNDPSDALVGEAVYCAAAKAAAWSSARKECSRFPCTVMMPRGPGILSMREA